MTNQRAKNLSLARGIFGTQVAISSIITPGKSSNNTKLTRQCQGKVPISDDEAKQYAERLNLPKEWFDRDNERLLNLSNEEYTLINAVLAATKEFKQNK